MLIEKFNFDLTKEEVVAVTVAMLGAARVDGVKPEEEALIKGFYSSTSEVMPDFDGLDAYWSQGEAKLDKVVVDADKRELLVYLVLMTAYADGHMSAAEEAYARKVAAEVEISAERFTEMNEDVREELLSTLASLPDSASVAKVASEL